MVVEGIFSVEDLTPGESAALAQLAIKLQATTGKRLISHRVAAWEKVPPDVLTPAVVREIIRQELHHLDRRAALERFVAKNLNFNGVAFLRWEEDPTRMRLGDGLGPR